jgi:hypothetical protein
MLFSRILTMALLGGFVGAAQDSKPNLSGNWQLKAPAKTASAMTLVIEQKDNAIHVVRTVTDADGKVIKLDYQCTTDGKECEVPGSKICLWFDKQALVEMDAGGDAVNKVTMKLDGTTLKMEVEHISPDGDAETYVFEKI